MMRAQILALIMATLLISAWIAVRSGDASSRTRASVGAARAYCDTGRGSFQPCAAIDQDGVET